MLRLKQFAAFFGIFGAAALLTYFWPAGRDLRFEIHSWGWLPYVGGILAYIVAFAKLTSWVSRSLGVNAQTKSSLHVGLEEGGVWLCMAAGGILASFLTPAYFVVSSGWVALAYSGLWAAAFGLEKAAQHCIKRSYEAKQARSDSDESKKDGEQK